MAERATNAFRNMTFGFLHKIYSMLIPFVIRTVLIYKLGIEYVGLNGLFSSIISVLCITELDINTAIVFSMYKPIAEGDNATVCALMGLYRKYYRIIGLVIATLGLVLLPFVPNLIKSDIPSDVNVYLLYLLYLGTTVFSYWLFGYKNSILVAHQRQDLSIKVQLTIEILQNIIQILVLVFLRSFYTFLIVALLSKIIINISTAIVSNKFYPQFSPKGCLDKIFIKDINKKIGALFTSKISFVIISSADTIIISAFLGLTVLAVYQNYFQIISALSAFICIILTSCTAGIGNSFVVETKEKNFNDLNKFTLIIIWLSGFCCCCLLCLFQPFMELWVGRELMLSIPVVVCFVVYFYVFLLERLFDLYKNAAGIWQIDKWRPLVTALTNLTLNLLTVKYLGVYGVILSTIVSFVFIGLPWVIHNLFNTVFEKNWLLIYVRKLFLYSLVVLLSIIICYFVCNFINFSPLITFLIRGIVCFIISNSIFMLFFRKTKEFYGCVLLFDRITNQKFNFEKLIYNNAK